jgi:hypothetical protein
MTDSYRDELKQKLKDKLFESQMERIPSKVRNNILEKSLKNIGIDKDKLKLDLNNLNRHGGFTMDLNK